jgi:hypothetical protein
MDQYYRTTFDSDNYSTAHPILSPDEKTLYFVSDMPGTIGLSDLFKTQKRRWNFWYPVNLGNSINRRERHFHLSMMIMKFILRLMAIRVWEDWIFCI